MSHSLEGTDAGESEFVLISISLNILVQLQDVDACCLYSFSHVMVLIFRKIGTKYTLRLREAILGAQESLVKI